MKKTFNNYGLQQFFNILNKINAKKTIGYAISRFKRQAAEQLAPYIEQKQKLLEQYGQKKDNGDLYISQSSENYSKFIQEFFPIANIKVTIDVFQVSQKDFQSCEQLISNEELDVNDFDLLQQIFIKKEQGQDKIQ